MELNYVARLFFLSSFSPAITSAMNDIKDSINSGMKVTTKDDFFTGGNGNCTGKELSLYTVDEAINKMGFRPFQWMITLLCGIIILANTVEVMVLFILPILCESQWELSSAEEAALTSALFVGALIGSILWGLFADNFGRKKSIFGMGLMLLSFGTLSAIKLTSDDRKLPGYPWLLVCRFGVGLGAACILQVYAYYIEFLPQKFRAVCTIFVMGWGSLGSIIAGALATAIIGESGLSWHWYLGISASPLLLVIVMIPFFPESVRYYLVHGKQKEATKVLEHVAWMNCRLLPEGNLVLHEERTCGSYATSQDSLIHESNPPVANHFCKKLTLLVTGGRWMATGILLVIWFTFGWLYFGGILLTSNMVQYNPLCDGTSNTTTTNQSNSSCNELDTANFLEIMVTASSELPGLLLNIIVIEVIGRKLTLAFDFTIVTIGFGLLFLCLPRGVLVLLFFLIRTFSMAGSLAVIVYTAELYPTAVRGVGMGVLNSISRLGAISTPYVAQVLFEESAYATIGIYAGSSAITVLLSLLLPQETKGQRLK